MMADIELLAEGLTFRLTYTYTPGTPATTNGPPEDCDIGEDETLDVSKIEYLLPNTLWYEITPIIQSEHCFNLSNLLQEMLLTVCRAG